MALENFDFPTIPCPVLGEQKICFYRGSEITTEINVGNTGLDSTALETLSVVLN